jgi:pyridoxine 4-dehydrogenase
MSDTALPTPGGTYRLGSHDLARVGYGAMSLEHLAEDRAAAVDLVRHAIELGVDHIDTAEFYGHSFANQVVGEAVRGNDHVVVVSKVGADPDREGPIPLKAAQRPEQLKASVDDNLRSLGLEQIPVVNLRRLDARPGLQATGDQIVDLDDQLEAMIDMRDAGKIGGIGISAITMDVLQRALPAGIVCVQNAYSLVSRTYEDMLQLCLAEGIAWVPFFPLGGAFPGLPKVTENALAQDVAKKHGVSAQQVGLAWLLAHASNTMLIPGTSSREHLEENVAVGSITLDAETLAELDEVSAPGAQAPDFAASDER